MTQTFQAHDFCLLVDESTHANMLGDIWEVVYITLLENNGDQIFFFILFLNSHQVQGTTYLKWPKMNT